MKANKHSKQETSPRHQSRHVQQDGQLKQLSHAMTLQMYEEALNYFLPCGFLIDVNKTLLHVFGSGVDYLAISPGNMHRLNISDNVIAQLQGPINTAVHRAQSSMKPCVIQPFEVKVNQTVKVISLHVQPLEQSAHYFIVAIEEKALQPEASPAIEVNYEDNNSQAIISKLEAKVALINDSLIASKNEADMAYAELGSTNKALQSTNETLKNINSEYQNKIAELVKANTDIDNILRSTNIGAVFIDNQFNIRFFTPSICPIYDICEADIGRSLKTFNHSIKLKSLNDQIEQVIQSKSEYKQEVQTEDGQWYLLHIMPYLSDDKVAAGAIVMLVNITDEKIVIEKLKAADARLKLALQSSSVGVWSMDFDKDVIVIDDTIKDIFGLEDKSELNQYKAFDSYLHPEDRKNVEQIINTVIEEKSSYSTEFRIIRQDKKVRHLISRGRIHYDEVLGKNTMIGIAWDITERIRLEEQVIDFDGRKIVMDDFTDGWWDWNLETNQEYMSPKFKAMFGYKDHELPNTVEAWQSLILPEDLAVAMANFKKHIDTDGEYPYIQEARYKHRNGSTIWVICRGKALKDKNGNFTRMVGTHTDITALKQAEIQLNSMAMHDMLTGLPNRSQFFEYLPQAIQRAQRKGCIMAVFFIDLDNFKTINDSLGHNVGDQLLKAVTKRLANTAREIDFLARLGGDEFAIIVEDVEHNDEIIQIPDRLVKALARPFMLLDHEISATISIGVATYPDAGDTAEELLQHADIAMYRAKEMGKNRYVFFDQKIHQQVLRNHTVKSALRKAIEHNEFSLAYQPLYSVESGTVIGLEVLLRWNNKQLGNPKPAEFIPAAESDQMIIPLGEWVLKTALDEYQTIISETKCNKLILTVNVSGKQLSSKQSITSLLEIVKASNVSPKNIVFELTETNLMEHFNEVRGLLNDLNEAGIQLALDDFGTGYSSMQYLKHLPISFLKIDQSFVQDINKDENDMAIIKAIISLAQNLNLSTIAEGVEDEKQIEFLKQQHCHYAQGYCLAEPMPLAQLKQFLQN